MPIQVKNLTHIYSEGMPYETVALKDVSLHIDDGSFVGIIGHTGSGKSTLIQHLNGLLKPSSGSIIVDGMDLTDSSVKLRDIRRMIGLVFQYPEYQLFEESVEKDVAFGPMNLGLSEEEASARVKEALALVDLPYEEIRERSPFDLSGGQKRRIAIAGVLAMKPRVLILDEPTAGLDPKARKDILKLVGNVHKKENNTIILVSHNMGDIAAFSEQVIVMEKGSIVMAGRPEEIFSHAEKIKEMGLGLPPAAGFMRKLQKKNISAPSRALTIDQAEREILSWLGGGA